MTTGTVVETATVVGLPFGPVVGTYAIVASGTVCETTVIPGVFVGTYAPVAEVTAG